MGLEGGFKASRGREGGLKPSALKGASRMLEGGFKGASRGLHLEGGLKGASTGLQRREAFSAEGGFEDA